MRAAASPREAAEGEPTELPTVRDLDAYAWPRVARTSHTEDEVDMLLSQLDKTPSVSAALTDAPTSARANVRRLAGRAPVSRVVLAVAALSFASLVVYITVVGR